MRVPDYRQPQVALLVFFALPALLLKTRRGQPWQQCRESAGQGCVNTPDPLTITN